MPSLARTHRYRTLGSTAARRMGLGGLGANLLAAFAHFNQLDLTSPSIDLRLAGVKPIMWADQTQFAQGYKIRMTYYLLFVLGLDRHL